MRVLQNSGPDLPPGDGIPQGGNVGNKREHGGWIFQSSAGEYYFVEETAPQLNRGASECFFNSAPANAPACNW